MNFNLLNLSWEDILNLDKEKLIVFVGIAPIEEHGKHLPIGVDIYETEAWINLAIEKLDSVLPNYYYGKLPIIPFGFADMGTFPGNIHVNRELIYKITYSTLENIVKWGVTNIIIVSGHADPLHTITIEQSCEAINKEYGMVSIAPMGSIFNSKQKEILRDFPGFVEEKIKLFPNDFHAGWIETSNMLALYPELVNNNYQERPDISIKDNEMMDIQKVIDVIKNEGHIGFPKEASKELGIELNNNVGEEICKATHNFILRSNYEKYMHHPLYDISALKLKI
ncbi:creatininase family protein [Clostridioides difficile]|nr:creatininase family protein [Clostridioides difficile]